MPLLEEGWYKATICDFTVHRDGKITIYFCIDGERVKAKFENQKLPQLFLLLNLSPPKEIKRSTLTPLLNEEVVVKVENFEYEVSPKYTVLYSRVTSVRKDFPEIQTQTVKQSDEDILSEYLFSQFGFIKEESREN